MTKIHAIREQIKATEVYKKLSFIQKTIATKRNNVKAIENALNVIKNTSFDQWESKTQSNYLNKLILKELCNE